MKRIDTLLLPIVLAVSALDAGEPRLPWASNSLDQAMVEELSRVPDLHEEGYPKPYYTSFRAADTWAQEYRCTLEGIAFKSAQSQRTLSVDVRVGGYDLDNHSLTPNTGQFAQELPQDGDPFAVRHEIWSEVDDRYKLAAGDFLRKQAMRVRRGKTEYDTDDMTREAPLVVDLSTQTRPSQWPENADTEKLCVDLSKIFRDRPDLNGSRVSIAREFVSRRFMDTEGARVRYTSDLFRLSMDAEDITHDGMRVFASRAFLVPGNPSVSDQVNFAQAAKEMLADIDHLKLAPSTSPFNAPALVDPSVGSAILQAFATRLSGEQQRNPEGAQTFRDKLGKKVLPETVTLEDDPTLNVFKDQPLVGHYSVDEQGVKAQPVTLVDRGILKGYLLSRYPVVGFDHSNGHGRAAVGRFPAARSSNLLLKSSIVYARPQLEQLLRRECMKQRKPFGLLIERVRLWRQQDSTGQQQAFRILPTRVYLVDAKTGVKKLVRDLDMVGTPLDMLDKILALGDDAQVVNSMVDDVSGNLPVSTVVPTLLLQDVELQRAETKPERLPVLPAPRP